MWRYLTGCGLRAIELAHLGKVSKAFGALTSGGMPLEEAKVRDAFSAFLHLNNESPIASWRDVVVQSGGELLIWTATVRANWKVDHFHNATSRESIVLFNWLVVAGIGKPCRESFQDSPP